MFTFKDHESYLKLKTEIKKLAVAIRNAKGVLRKTVRPNWVMHKDVRDLKQMFRSRHIAASLLRGTPMHIIEAPKLDNPPNMTEISKLVKEYGVEVSNETVCTA